MLPIKSLGLRPYQWKFLSAPDRYFEASLSSSRPLVLESTRRQFLTARDILARLKAGSGHKACRGILLADDVGLGKTAVAALVAWVVASAGERRGVRILAPNDVMMRRWVDELHSHVRPLQKCARALGVRADQVKAGKCRLSAGSIQVVKHSYAALKSNLDCDLLIVDEAHRAKGENTEFSRELRRQKKYARRVLILTATPFSIRLDELKRMLTLIGGDAAHCAIDHFSGALDDFYDGNTARSPEVVAERLCAKAKTAVDALRSFVIRHGIDDLPCERKSFGDQKDWNIAVPPASSDEVELMLRMDRALRVAKGHGCESSGATNDPRFHVGWRHFDAERARLKKRDAPSRRAGEGPGGVPTPVHQTTSRQGGNPHEDGVGRRGREIQDRAGGKGHSLLPSPRDGTGVDGTPRLGIAQGDGTAMARVSLEDRLGAGARTDGLRAPR